VATQQEIATGVGVVANPEITNRAANVLKALLYTIE